jgi:hypothetical protein
MHFFITFALILAYGLLLIFALLHVVESLIARPTPWLRMRLEAGEPQNESLALDVTIHPAEPTPPPETSRPNQLGGNAHARTE